MPARCAPASPVVAPQWVIGWNLDEDYAYPVRISNPHLQQAPRLQFGRPHNLNPGRLKAPIFGVEVANLYPEGEIADRCRIANAGHLQITAAEEENQPGIVAVAELSVDGKTERVPVKTSTAISVGGPQQDPATEDVHTTDRVRTVETWGHRGPAGLDAATERRTWVGPPAWRDSARAHTGSPADTQCDTNSHRAPRGGFSQPPMLSERGVVVAC